MCIHVLLLPTTGRGLGRGIDIWRGSAGGGLGGGKGMVEGWMAEACCVFGAEGVGCFVVYVILSRPRAPRAKCFILHVAAQFFLVCEEYSITTYGTRYARTAKNKK